MDKILKEMQDAFEQRFLTIYFQETREMLIFALLNPEE